jgi:hypothetical protein
MLGERVNSPFTAEEESAINFLISEGKDFKFTNENGVEDCVSGLIELRYREELYRPLSIFGFEQFNIKESTRGGTRRKFYDIEKVAPRFQKLIFKYNKDGVGTAMCPDTKKNREKLADHFFSNQWEFVRKHDKDGEVSGSKIMAEIRGLAEKRRDERERMRKSGVTGGNKVDRVLAGLTADEQQQLIQKLVAKENEKRAPIPITSIASPAISIEELVGEIPEKPKGVAKFNDLKKAAKDFVFERNTMLINMLKGKNEKQYHLLPEYKTQIQPQIDFVVKMWLEGAEAPAEVDAIAQ